jgi:Domain of unknown function (DUF1330)
MPAYIIAEHTITDPAKFEEYKTKVGPIIAKHGGRYLTKGGSHVILEKDRALWELGVATDPFVFNRFYEAREASLYRLKGFQILARYGAT